MAYKEVSRVEITEVVRRWQAGASVRGVSRISGLSRNTIQKYVLIAEQCGLERDGPAPTESQLMTLVQLNTAGRPPAAIPTDKVLEPWAERIGRWVREEGLQLTRVQELLLKDNCSVAYTSLRRFVARRGWSRSSHTTVRMVDTGPGEVAEMDFGRLGLVLDPENGRRRVAWAMVIVLGYSRHSFLWPMFNPPLSGTGQLPGGGGWPRRAESQADQRLPGIRPTQGLLCRSGAGTSPEGQAEGRVWGPLCPGAFLQGWPVP